MNRAQSWTDGYIIAVAKQMTWFLAPAWQMLQGVDPALDIAALNGALERLEEAEIPVFVDGRADLAVPAPLRPLVDEIHGLVERVRRAGRSAFDTPSLRHYQLPCTLDRPMMYLGMSHAATAPAEEVEILTFGDIPPGDPDWTGRAAATGFRQLRGLHLASHDLSMGQIWIDLQRLESLEVLDLADCRLTDLPAEARALPAVRWLSLAANPLARMPDLSGIPRLEYLSLKRTPLSPDLAAPLRQRGVEVGF